MPAVDLESWPSMAGPRAWAVLAFMADYSNGAHRSRETCHFAEPKGILAFLEAAHLCIS
jgi:hypothetical protein